MTPRRYSTDLRNEQTAVARHRILESGRLLFASQGYAGTTLAQVADGAGVSVQTVYNVVGGKSVLLKAVYDAVLAGDEEPLPMAQRPLVQAMLTADDARTALGHYAQMGRELSERIMALLTAVLAQAATGDPVLQAFADTVDQERAIGTTATARHIEQRFGLRPGLEVADAADLLWALTAPELTNRLVNHRGWSWDKYQAWLAQAFADALLGPSASRGA